MLLLARMASVATLAARNLVRHRMRTAVAISAIAFGVVALVLTGGFIEWIYWAIREASIQTGLGHVQITRPGFRAAGAANPKGYLLPQDAPELAAMRKLPGVEVVDERLVVSGLASTGETTVAFAGEAVDSAADLRISKALPVDGQNLASADPTGILLGRGLAAALGARPGEKVTLLVAVPGGGVNAVEGVVRGLFATGAKAYDDSAVRMPIQLGRELLRTRGSHLWVLGLSATERTDAAAGQVRATLGTVHFETATWLELSDFYRKSVTLLSRQVNLVALLIGVIIVLGISNTMTMNVLERTGEIGTMMAVGARRRKVLRLFILEGLLLGLVGGLAGLAIGLALAAVLSYVGIPMPPPPGRTEGYSAEILVTTPLALGAFALALSSTVLASLYPAFKASRLPIVDALRHNV
jgi:putative ABC transport system permease protein